MRGGSQKKAAGQKHDLLKQATSNQAKKLKVGNGGSMGCWDVRRRAGTGSA